jgi:hypothetical protein
MLEPPAGSGSGNQAAASALTQNSSLDRLWRVEKYRNAAEAASNRGPLSYREFIHQDEFALMTTFRSAPDAAANWR